MLDEKLYRALQVQKAGLEADVFKAPPKTFDEFQKRLGRWQQLADTLQLMADMARKEDEDLK